MLNDSQNAMYKTEPIPVNMSIEVTFMTDNFFDMISFANRWVYCAVTKSLNMDVVFDGTNFSIQVEADSTLTVPEKDMQIETVNAYEFVTNLIVHGYISQDAPIEEFPQLVPLRDIVITPYFVSTADARTVFPPPGFQGTNIEWEQMLAEQTLRRTPAYIYSPEYTNKNQEPTEYEQISFSFDLGEGN